MAHLNEMKPGSKAKVISVDGNPEVTNRLSALGVLPGKEIELTHVAPLSDPITMKIENQEISIRINDARGVNIELQ